MRNIRKIILTILLGLTISSCSIYKVVHEPLILPEQCIFEKFTPEEITYIKGMSDVGKRIYRNQESCRIRQEHIDTLVEAHNKTHQE